MSERIKINHTEVLSHRRYTLTGVTFDYQKNDGTWNSITREVYDRGEAAAILLYNQRNNTIILTRQFRLPAFLSGVKEGLMTEVCAGMLDADTPEQAAIRETEEETGYRIKDLTKVCEAYVSPAATTEKLHLFVAAYEPKDHVSKGGGIEDEDIEVLEVSFRQGLEMIRSGEIKDAKTILLLYYAKSEGLLS